MGEEFVACSKKCKKVTKFAYMLKQQKEQEVLRAFETMLRKKIKKQQTIGTSAVNKTGDIQSIISGNRTSTDKMKQAIQFEKLNGDTSRFMMRGDPGKSYKSHRGISGNLYDGDEELKQ